MHLFLQNVTPPFWLKPARPSPLEMTRLIYHYFPFESFLLLLPSGVRTCILAQYCHCTINKSLHVLGPTTNIHCNKLQHLLHFTDTWPTYAQTYLWNSLTKKDVHCTYIYLIIRTSCVFVTQLLNSRLLISLYTYVVLPSLPTLVEFEKWNRIRNNNR